jgi:hypothetical protein
MEFLLGKNSALRIGCVVHRDVAGNTASAELLARAIGRQRADLPLLAGSSRFKIVSEPAKLAAVDLRFASGNLWRLLDKADLVIAKGASHFETLQRLPCPTYFMFTVYGAMSKKLTGLKRNAGIFARMSPYLRSYAIREEDRERLNVSWNLRKAHHLLSTKAYGRFVERSKSEGWCGKRIDRVVEEGGCEVRSVLKRGTRGAS